MKTYSKYHDDDDDKNTLHYNDKSKNIINNSDTIRSLLQKKIKQVT